MAVLSTADDTDTDGYAPLFWRLAGSMPVGRWTAIGSLIGVCALLGQGPRPGTVFHHPGTPCMGQEGQDTVKAIVQDSYGSPDVLELRDIDPPVVTDDEVLVRVGAAAVNPPDWAGHRGAVHRAPRHRTAQAAERCAGFGCRGHRRGGRHQREGFVGRGRGLRVGDGHLRRVRGHRRDHRGAQAHDHHVRAGRRRPMSGLTR